MVIFILLFLIVVLGGFNGAVTGQVRRLLLIDELFPKFVVFLLGVFEEAATGNKANDLPKGSVAHETLHDGDPGGMERSRDGCFSVSDVTEEEKYFTRTKPVKNKGPTRTYTPCDAFAKRPLRGAKTRSDLEYRH
jgi:hypothetical protein